MVTFNMVCKICNVDRSDLPDMYGHAASNARVSAQANHRYTNTGYGVSISMGQPICIIFDLRCESVNYMYNYLPPSAWAPTN